MQRYTITLSHLTELEMRQLLDLLVHHFARNLGIVLSCEEITDE